jgi:hypothetical protein
MRILRKYKQKKRLKENIFREYEKALIEKNYIRVGILSKRFLKL